MVLFTWFIRVDVSQMFLKILDSPPKHTNNCNVSNSLIWSFHHQSDWRAVCWKVHDIKKGGKSSPPPVKPDLCVWDKVQSGCFFGKSRRKITMGVCRDRNKSVLCQEVGGKWIWRGITIQITMKGCCGGCLSGCTVRFSTRQKKSHRHVRPTYDAKLIYLYPYITYDVCMWLTVYIIVIDCPSSDGGCRGRLLKEDFKTG